MSARPTKAIWRAVRKLREFPFVLSEKLPESSRFLSYVRGLQPSLSPLSYAYTHIPENRLRVRAKQ